MANWRISRWAVTVWVFKTNKTDKRHGNLQVWFANLWLIVFCQIEKETISKKQMRHRNVKFCCNFQIDTSTRYSQCYLRHQYKTRFGYCDRQIPTKLSQLVDLPVNPLTNITHLTIAPLNDTFACHTEYIKFQSVVLKCRRVQYFRGLFRIQLSSVIRLSPL